MVYINIWRKNEQIYWCFEPFQTNNNITVIILLATFIIYFDVTVKKKRIPIGLLLLCKMDSKI